MVLSKASQTLIGLPPALSHGLVAVSTFALLSFCCSVSLFLYLTWKLVIWHLRKGSKEPVNQFFVLIYNLLLADIQQACAFLLNINALSKNGIFIHTTTCWAQGWFVSTGDLGGSIFICQIAVHTFFSIVKGKRPSSKVFYSCIAAGWAFNYFMGAIGPLLHGRDFYVRAASWVGFCTSRHNFD